jgi:alpha-methylacyl-CoA racemase
MGPLSGFRVVEFAGIGPGPMCAMLLADLGATVLRLDRPTDAALGIERPQRFNLLNRSRRSVRLDLKRPEGIAFALDLIADADALIEGFRPGTMERLGLGPEPCLERNPKLVYGRITGWGQEGPLALAAGHDLNYIALTGALHAIGRAGQPPVPPLNLVGDYGGGALYLALGLTCALLEAQRSGQGQVVDAAMIDGAASLMTPFYGLNAAGVHSDRRGENTLDSGAPYYDVYVCADGRYVSIAPIETKFRSEFYRLAGIDEASLPDTRERANWPAIKKIIAERLITKTQAEWCAVMEGSDACFAPVLAISEAAKHPHHQARGTFIEVDGIVQPAPAPRFSRTKPAMPTSPPPTGLGGEQALADWGVPDHRIAELRSAGIISGDKAPA